MEAGVWGFGYGKLISVELSFDDGYGNHLFETPLSKDQEIVELADGQLKVTATIPDTPQLRWWLMGFGEGLEVLSPDTLRAEMAFTATEMYQKYKG